MNGWQTRLLPDAYWFQEGPGVRKWQFRSSGIKLLNVTNITKEGVLDPSKSDRYLSDDEAAGKYCHFLVDEGDLVIASSGISFDEDGLLRTRGAFVKKEHLPLCLNTSTIRFKAKPGISSLAWLRYWLESHGFRSQISRLVTGAAQQNFGPSHLKGIAIPIPPFAEQERIVRILDEADTLRLLRVKADNLTRDAFLSCYDALFGNPIANPKRWPTRKLTEVCFPKQWPTITESELTESGYTVYGANGRIGFYHSYNHESPTVLVTCRGATCGTINVCEPKSYVTGNSMALDDPDESIITRDFLEWTLRVRGMADTVTGAAQPQITRKNLEGVMLPTPPLDEQKTFTSRVTEIRMLEAAQSDSRKRLNELFQTLLHRAFQGEL